MKIIMNTAISIVTECNCYLWMCLLRMEINNFKFLKCNDMKKYAISYRYNMDNNLGVMECTLSFDPETKPILNVTSFIFNKFSHHYFGYGAMNMILYWNLTEI